MRLFVAAVVAGSWLLQQQAELPIVALAPCGVAALLMTALIPQRCVVARATVLVLAGALAGVGWAAWGAAARLVEALPRAAEGEDIEIEGAVEALPQVLEGTTRFVFAVESVVTPAAV